MVDHKSSSSSDVQQSSLGKRCSRTWLFFLAITVLLPGTLSAQSFDRGATNLSILIGSGQAFGEDYTVVGVGAGYYVSKGLELGLELEAWLNGGPDIYKVSPGFRYVINSGSNINPYVGAFYRRVYIENFDDRDSWGGRAGAFIATGPRSYVGVGVVYTELVDCNKLIYQSCSDTYPELTFGFSF